jgi:ABC-type bacteriocin/lantibiotic exporter with double-glycine peptidase domain
VYARGRFRRASSRKLPVVRQRAGNDCGPASLATIAVYHGCRIDYDNLCDVAAVDRNGTDLLALSRIAERLGFRAQGIKASYDTIPTCRLPAIAQIRHRVGDGHFVVIHRWTSTHVVLADPAVGLRKLSREAFCRRSTGYLLVIQPPPTPRSRAITKVVR